MSEPSSDDGSDPARELLPAADYLDFLELAPRARRLAVERLTAIAEWNDGRERSPKLLERLAARSGVKPKRFYQLAAGWNPKRPSLASLGVGAAMPASRASTIPGGVRDAARRELRTALAEVEGIGPAKAFARVRALGLDPQPSERALYRWWTAIRAGLPRDLLGGRYLYCYVAVDRVLDGWTQHEAAFLVDADSGLVLGSSAATGIDMFSAYRAATEDAVSRLGRMRLKGVTVANVEKPMFDAVPAEDDFSFENLQRMAHLPPYAFEPAFDQVAFRRAVDAVVRALGGRIGRIPIVPSPLPWRARRDAARTFYLFGEEGADDRVERYVGPLTAVPGLSVCFDPSEDAPASLQLDLDDFRAILARAVDRHDASLLDRSSGARESRSAADARARLVAELRRAG